MIDSFALTRNAWQVLIDDRVNLGLPDLTIQPLCDFLRASSDPAKNPDILPSSQWSFVLDQAELLIRHLYPHLPFKQRDFPDADPLGLIQKLRPSLQHQPPVMGELDFHIQMLKIFASVRDPHTAYGLPKFFHTAVAFLPFRAGVYEDANGRRRYIVTSVMQGFDHPDFKPGVELVGETGDFEAQVQMAASLSPGANPASQLERGILRLTVQPLATSGTGGWREPFEDEAASFAYQTAEGAERKCIALPWGVGCGKGLSQNIPGSAFSVSSSLYTSQYAATILWDRKCLYDMAAVSGGPPNPAQLSSFPDVFYFQAAPGRQDKQFGYINIKRFNTDASVNLSHDLPAEFGRILKMMQTTAPDGLILDIRGNPGGDIVAAESMLQMLTPRAITPANFHLANTSAIAAILKTTTTPELRPWTGGDDLQPLPYGPPITAGRPITLAPNATGQLYQGPVALLVDALTYSAADIFAGGFSDNAVGLVIGADASTGGGGASVWPQSDLVAMVSSADLDLRALPAGTSMSLAFMRSSRVGPKIDQPIEDIGVYPDMVQPRTLNDLMTRTNPAESDLVSFACDQLAKITPRRISVSEVVQASAGVKMTVTTVNLTRIEFILDEDIAPVLTVAAGDAPQQILVPFHPDGTPPVRIIVRGNSAADLLTSIRVYVMAPESSRRRQD